MQCDHTNIVRNQVLRQWSCQDCKAELNDSIDHDPPQLPDVARAMLTARSPR